MYKINALDENPFPSLNYMRNNCSDLPFTCGDVNVVNGAVEIRWNGGNHESQDSYDIAMNADGTYKVIANDLLSNYDRYDVFATKNTPPSGHYEVSSDNYGDIYTFKNIDGKTVFIVFNTANGYYIAGDFRGNHPSILFNTIAAEDIQAQW